MATDYERQQMKFSSLVLGEQTLARHIKGSLPSRSSPIELICARSEKEALRFLSNNSPDLVVLDLETQRANPYKFLSMLFKSDGHCDVIVVAQRPDVESIVKCMRLGVTEFLQTPQENRKLGESLKKIFTKWQKKQRSSTLQEQQHVRFDLNHIIAGSATMQKVITVAQKIIQRPWVTVLIRGETGTGKEVIARGIHYGTTETQNKPFVEVNCTAIPESLLESELFGYEKGAFTDAKFNKKGLLEMAEGGSLFLDEIGDMNLALQAKLLKAIEEKRFRRLGGTTDIQVKLRVITGTNADLESKVEIGAFRTDLYYRLNVINIYLPPLQDRGTDIILLADYFLDRFCGTYGIPRRRLSADAEEMLLNYDWP
ncbi:MAG: sigma-54-dependent transcriptional regulator [bacterium]